MAAGGRAERAMDGARPSQGRVSVDCLRGTAARPRERPARCAGPDREAALTEGKAASGRQADALLESRLLHTIAADSYSPAAFRSAATSTRSIRRGSSNAIAPDRRNRVKLRLTVSIVSPR